MSSKKKGKKKASEDEDGGGGEVSAESLEEANSAKEALTNAMQRDVITDLEQTKSKLLLNIKDLKEQLAQQKEDQAGNY